MMKNPDKLWTKDFILLLFAYAIANFSIEMLMPTLPIFLNDQGNAKSEIGLIMGMFTIAAIIIRFFTASGSRKFGERLLLYAGLLISFAGIAAFALGTTFVTATLFRMIQGVGFGITVTIFTMIAMKIIPSKQIGEGLGYLGVGMVVIASSAPFFALWLLDSYGPIPLFLVASSTQIIALILMLFVIIPINPEQVLEQEIKKDSRINIRSFLGEFLEKKIRLPALLTLFLGTCFGGTMTFTALYGQYIHLSNVGWFFMAFSVGALVSRLLTGKIFDRLGHSWIFIPFSILLVIGFVILSQATSLFTFTICGLLYGISTGALFPGLQAWIAKRAAPERRGEATATFFNAFDIGVSGGAIILGILLAATSFSTMYLFLAFVMVAFLFVFIISQALQKKKTEQIYRSKNSEGSAL